MSCTVPGRPARLAGRLGQQGHPGRRRGALHRAAAREYGEHGAATVWSTAGTKVFLPGIHDTATLEDVSKLCGTLGDGDTRPRSCRPNCSPGCRTGTPWSCPVSRSPVVIKFRPSWRRIEARLGRAPKPLPSYATRSPLGGPPQVIADLATAAPPRPPNTTSRTMTSPPNHPRPEHCRRLAAQVAALRGQVAALETRLDHDVAGQLVALAEIKRLRSQVTNSPAP